jgi:hypothetical protein
MDLTAGCYMSAHLWDEDSVEYIMMACIIMHNMIVEDERDEKDDFSYEYMGENVTEGS